MPIYEYQCAACGHIVERWQKFSEAPLTICPQCGGGLGKLISACSFQLKGSGWYVTDYAGKQQTTGTSEQPKEDCGDKTAGGDNGAGVSESPPPKIK